MASDDPVWRRALLNPIDQSGQLTKRVRAGAPVLAVMHARHYQVPILSVSRMVNGK